MANRRKEKKDSFQPIADDCNALLNKKRKAEPAPKEEKVAAAASSKNSAVVGPWL